MGESGITGPFKHITSSAFSDAVLDDKEVKPVKKKQEPHQEKIAEKLEEDKKEQPKEQLEQEQGQPELSSGPSFLDVPILHLHKPEPIVYENAPRRAPPLDQYRVGNKKKLKEFGGSLQESIGFKAISEIFTLGENTPDNREKMMRLQENLYQEYLKGLSFPDMVDTYLALAKIINKIGLTVAGSGKNEMHNSFMNTFRYVFVTHHDMTEREVNFLDTYINKTMVQKKEEDYWRGMMQPVGIAAGNYIHTRTYVRHEEKDQTERLHTILEKEQGELKNLAQELLEAIKTQRRFGLRSSFYQDDLFHDESDGWVMMHPFEFEKTNIGTLAAIFLASRDAVMKTGISAKRYSVFEHKAMKANVEGAAFDSKLAWKLGLDGELYMGGSNSRISVREIFQRFDQEPLYDLLRLSFIARVHDLVVPAGGVKTLPGQKKLRDSIKKASEGKITEEEFRTVIREFMVQRVKYINNRDRVTKDEESEENKIRTKVGEKPLAGNVYELAEGYHRTAYAEANFLEYEGYPMSELDTTGTFTYRRPYNMPLYTHTRVVPEQKFDANNE